ncbi:MAG TPA: response regulator [Chitinophagales bacterium]|nr:response regulator [Chitinophagales bacterium]
MRKTIMVIDDQSSTRRLLVHYLGNFFKVIERPSAKDALEALRSGARADAIVADIIMPEMSGIEFLHACRKEHAISLPPVIMLTSVENSSEKLKCFQSGARDYMMKPFNPEELRMRINNLLAN